MEIYPTLKFNEAGTEVSIVFKENEEEDVVVYTTKEAVFETINVLLKTDQITLEKADKLRTEILNADNLRNDETADVTIGESILRRKYFFPFPETCIKKPLKPFFQLCDKSGKLHYHITCTQGYAFGFCTKSDGKKLLSYLKEDGHITESESEILLGEIEKLSSLED